jgi:signal transduction histidine kinase/ligand-binding sensor domain-containing protein/DNA-binding response OmpR family regulator
MWFGTDAGLNRFDGYEFRVFRQDPLDTNSLPYDEIMSIGEDGRGKLWLVSILGQLATFDEATEKFAQISIPPPGLAYPRPLSPVFGRDGTTWYATSKGLYRFGTPDAKPIRYVHRGDDPCSASCDTLWAVCQDRSGILWLGTARGLEKFDPASGRFLHYPHGPGVRVTAIQEDRGGLLWICADDGFYSFNPATQKFDLYKDSQPSNPSGGIRLPGLIHEDRAGMLWVGGANGVSSFDRFAGEFRRYNDPSKGPQPEPVTSLVEDNRGVIWVGSPRGLQEYNRLTDSFVSYQVDPDSFYSMGDNGVNAICRDRAGSIWIGTNAAGVYQFDWSRRRFVYIAYEPDAQGALGLGLTKGPGEDRSGRVWLGTGGGRLDAIKSVTSSLKRSQRVSGNIPFLAPGTTSSILQDRMGMIWVGTIGGGRSPTGGLHRLDTATGVWKHYASEPHNPASLSSTHIRCLWEDQSGTLWIGTAKGLDAFDRKTGTFSHLTTKDGLSSGDILGILEDSHGFLWLGTGKGLSKYDPRTRRLENYDETDGFGMDQPLKPVYRLSRTDDMVFGGPNGLIRFLPDSIRDNAYVPPIVVTALIALNKPVLLDTAVSEKKLVELSYKDNVIEFQFAALNYLGSKKNQYAYKLEGFDKDWTYCGTRRHATYTNLDDGTYLFRVKGSNDDGVWNEEGASIDLHIAPPYWRAWWAYLVYGVLLASALYGVRRYEVARFKLKNDLRLQQVETEKSQAIEQMKSRFFADISHEFRTPLTLIMAPVEDLLLHSSDEDTNQKLKLVHRNARRLLVLINELLDLSKLEGGSMKLEAKRGNIVPFLESLVISFRPLVRAKGVQLTMDAQMPVIELYFDRQKVEKIITNLLSNAFKFTPEGGRIDVAVSVSQGPEREEFTDDRDRRYVAISVKDTGIGIPEDKLPHVFDRFYQADSSLIGNEGGTGIGLSLAQELVELHHGSISVSSSMHRPVSRGGGPTEGGPQELGGTEFVVLLPMGRDHLKEEEILEGREEIATYNLTPVLESPEIASLGRTLPADESHAVGTDREARKPIILVVEDNAEVREYIRDCLRPYYQVTEARDGSEGVELARKTIPDLIITDIMMPGMDGSKLTRIVKEDEKTNHIPVIMLTAKAQHESKIEGLETGVDDYLIKPFDKNELLARARNLIETRRKLRIRFSEFVILKPSDVAVKSMDTAFLQRVMAIVEKYLGDEGFTVEDLGREVGMSRTQIHRKLRALTNQSPREIIRTTRLFRAMDLLKQQGGTVSEIAYSVGFSSPAYFTKCFREQFGFAPKEAKSHSAGIAAPAAPSVFVAEDVVIPPNPQRE